MSVQTSGFLPWLADAAHASGLPVVEVEGWRTRGHEPYVEVRGVVCHDTGTGTPAPGNMPSLNQLIKGRSDLAGPLATYGLGRDGTVYVIAAGVCWHAGTGVYSWLPRDAGNWYAVGIEAEMTGGGICDWTPAQRNAYPRLVAAILATLGVPASRAIGHKEYSDAGKPDPECWDMNDFRASVADLMGHDMDVNTPIAYPADAAAYFESIAPGLGQHIAANFPLGRTAPLGLTLAYAAMRSCAADYQAADNSRQLAALATTMNAVGDVLKGMAGQLSQMTELMKSIAAHFPPSSPAPSAAVPAPGSGFAGQVVNAGRPYPPATSA